MGGSGLRAAIVDYNADEMLLKTEVNVAALKVRPSTLAEVFALVERQTPYTFIYVASQLPTEAKMAFESADLVSLARLLSTVTALTDLVFQRRGQKIVVRLRRKDEEVAAAAPGGGERSTSNIQRPTANAEFSTAGGQRLTLNAQRLTFNSQRKQSRRGILPRSNAQKVAHETHEKHEIRSNESGDERLFLFRVVRVLAGSSLRSVTWSKNPESSRPSPLHRPLSHSLYRSHSPVSDPDSITKPLTKDKENENDKENKPGPTRWDAAPTFRTLSSTFLLNRAATFDLNLSLNPRGASSRNGGRA